MKMDENIHKKTGWKEAENYPKGTKVKMLRDDGISKTFLLKVPPDYILNSHSHNFNEQQLIIEGEYENRGKHYKAGTYRFIPANKKHGPYKSKNGLTVMVIWDNVNKN